MASLRDSPTLSSGVLPRNRSWEIASGLVKSARPKQWVKSVLVPAAPAAAGVIFQPSVLERTLVAMAAFTLAAAAAYLINDVIDVEADRAHPLKRNRPVARGQVPSSLAVGAGVFLMVVAVAAGGLLATWSLAITLVAYLALTAAYSKWLKAVPVLELLVVAAGFVLRPVAGAAAAGVPVSQWFLIVTSFGSLFMVAGKRYSEVVSLGEAAKGHRTVLSAYSAAYLSHVREISAAVALLAYCLWAFQRAGTEHASLPWFQLSIAPITLGLLRYALGVERGEGGAPEDLVLHDRTVLASGVAWLALFSLGVANV